MTLRGEYLGMTLSVDDADTENLQFFQWCAQHSLHLQACSACRLLRYPPTTACPWCACPQATWQTVDARGTVYSYTEVQHAIQPAFKTQTPYVVLLVELDTQRGEPSPDEALRIIGNLALPDGTLAPPALIARVGVGTRVRAVFKDVGPGLSLPMWAIDEAHAQPASVWRYPE